MRAKEGTTSLELPFFASQNSRSRVLHLTKYLTINFREAITPKLIVRNS